MILINILEDMESAKGGIINLMKTYEDDVKMNCDLLCLIESITVELTKYQTEDVDLTHPDLIQNHGVPTTAIGINQHAVNNNGFK